jgi:hypothetical protein
VREAIELVLEDRRSICRQLGVPAPTGSR